MAAPNATIFRAQLEVSDISRGHYHGYNLILARHPSETDERMMVRLLAFALHADAALSFTKGLCADDEPDLWRKDLTGAVELWIELGQPDERRLRKASGRARHVVVYAYQARVAKVWWEQAGADLQRFANLSVRHVPDEAVAALGRLAQRNMQLQCTIQDNQVWIGDAERTVDLELGVWK